MSVKITLTFPEGFNATSCTIETPLQDIGVATSGESQNGSEVSAFVAKTVSRILTEIKGHPHSSTEAAPRSECGEDMEDENESLSSSTKSAADSAITVILKDMGGKERSLVVDPAIKVLTLKERYEEMVGIPPDQQCLVHKQQKLKDDKKLLECGLADDALIHMVLMLRGS